MSIDIDAIEARANAATPGPWYSDNSDNMDDAGNHYSVMYGDGWYLARVWSDLKQTNYVADAAFMAAARQDVPALCAEVRELRAALGRLQGEVETIINTEPHEDVCLVTRGGDCTCWQARLQTALDGEK